MADEHFPWSYTGFGVICACGDPMDRDELCRTLRADKVACEAARWPEQHRDDCAWCAAFTDPPGSSPLHAPSCRCPLCPGLTTTETDEAKHVRMHADREPDWTQPISPSDLAREA